MGNIVFTPSSIRTLLNKNKKELPFTMINDEVAYEELFYKVRAAKEFLKNNPSFDDMEVSTKIAISGYFTIPLKVAGSSDSEFVFFTDIEVFLNYNEEDDSISPTVMHNDIRISHVYIPEDEHTYKMARSYPTYRSVYIGASVPVQEISDSIPNYIEKHCPYFTHNLGQYVDTQFIFDLVSMVSTALAITEKENKAPARKKAPTLVE